MLPEKVINPQNLVLTDDIMEANIESLCGFKIVAKWLFYQNVAVIH